VCRVEGQQSADTEQKEHYPHDYLPARIVETAGVAGKTTDHISIVVVGGTRRAAATMRVVDYSSSFIAS
jgi:hypothetical protein